MPYTKPLKARSGASMQYDSGDYPGSQAMVLQAADWETFPQRQAQARSQGRYVGIGFAHGIKGTGRGPFESGVVRVSNTGRVTVFTGAAASSAETRNAKAATRAEMLRPRFRMLVLLDRALRRRERTIRRNLVINAAQ